MRVNNELFSKMEKEKAYENMLNQELVFFPSDTLSLQKLIKFVKKKNHKIYNNPKFEYISSQYDQNLIIAATPELGVNELGVFAGKNFEKNEIITSYEGENKWGIRSAEEITTNIKSCKESGDYLWEIDCQHGKSMIINSITTGNIARFVNDSLNKNAEAQMRNGQVVYVAKREIKFGEEITVCYGKEFFSRQHPRKSYHPETLQILLSRLYQLKNKETISLASAKDIETIKIVLDVIGWNKNFTSDLNENKIAKNCNEGFLSLPTSRSTSEKSSLFLNKYNQPMLFDLSVPQHVKLLCDTTNVALHQSSTYKLFVAPTGYLEEKRKLALFTSEKISKNQPVCIIKGKKFTRQQLSEQKEIEENFLFVINKNLSIYCKDESSEALFLHGVSRESKANVTLVNKNGVLMYVSTREISPGQEIVAFFGNDYSFASEESTHIAKVVDEFNKHQLSWDAKLVYNAKTEIYSLTVEQHNVETNSAAMTLSCDEQLLPETKNEISNNEKQLPNTNCQPGPSTISNEIALFYDAKLTPHLLFCSNSVISEQPVKLSEDCFSSKIRIYSIDESKILPELECPDFSIPPIEIKKETKRKELEKSEQFPCCVKNEITVSNLQPAFFSIKPSSIHARRKFQDVKEIDFHKKQKFN